MTLEERVGIVKAIKYVDEIIEAAPFSITLELLEKYNCEYQVHGDDISYNSEGVDSAKIIKDAGRFLEFKRTEGVSSTDIIGKLLTLSKSRQFESLVNPLSTEQYAERVRKASVDHEETQPSFLATAHRIKSFSADR
jgi:ethanolamine-phosphate cytidylyltransferase